MKNHYYIIFICSLLIVGFVIFNFVTQRSLTYNRTNIEYANSLTAACHDAAKSINLEEIDMNEGVWKTKKEMKHTLDVFYESLSRNFGRNGKMYAEQMKERTPFVVLVDTDGFYISYNAVYDNYNNSVVPNTYDDISVISDINTWTEAFSNGFIRYYLSDYITVVFDSGEVYEGDRRVVYNMMSDKGVLTSEFDNLIIDEEFNNMKNHVIMSKIEHQVNYYANTQMINVNDYMTGYNIVLPELKGEDWARMIKSPSIISFMQGVQESLNGNLLNVYAYAAGELSYRMPYFIEGDYYHRLDNDMVTTVTTLVTIAGTNTAITEYFYNGIQINEIYSSMEECALRGAIPAPDEY